MKYLLLILVLVLGGCFSKSTSDSLKLGLETQGDIVEPAPLVNGNNNNVTVHGNIPTSKREIKTSSNADMESKYSSSLKISVGFNIFLLGVGILLIFKVAKKSKVIRLTSGILDNIGASAIAMATNATDPKDIASANHLRAETESARRHL